MQHLKSQTKTSHSELGLNLLQLGLAAAWLRATDSCTCCLQGAERAGWTGLGVGQPTPDS